MVLVVFSCCSGCQCQRVVVVFVIVVNLYNWFWLFFSYCSGCQCQRVVVVFVIVVNLYSWFWLFFCFWQNLFQRVLKSSLYEYPELTFPLTPGFGWNFRTEDNILFEFGKRSAMIWGLYFIKTEFKEPVTLRFRIGYYEDTFYKHK